ncbi:hypothetical protein KJ365_11385 [Glaciecola sp. XM2]|jgi:hypothetical protein|uniref:hypothetical protein n=1 Tax=Glaciecola sp. XM2 TaxID=1914931 RepID=UPI001BDE8CC0|nr:hypothetical protein [Glaciecola sp. XM2]MBT1451482.1 hypothetical protein [Glaciecola sp. XM2]
MSVFFLIKILLFSVFISFHTLSFANTTPTQAQVIEVDYQGFPYTVVFGPGLNYGIEGNAYFCKQNDLQHEVLKDHEYISIFKKIAGKAKYINDFPYAITKENTRRPERLDFHIFYINEDGQQDMKRELGVPDKFAGQFFVPMCVSFLSTPEINTILAQNNAISSSVPARTSQEAINRITKQTILNMAFGDFALGKKATNLASLEKKAKQIDVVASYMDFIAVYNGLNDAEGLARNLVYAHRDYYTREEIEKLVVKYRDKINQNDRFKFTRFVYHGLSDNVDIGDGWKLIEAYFTDDLSTFRFIAEKNYPSITKDQLINSVLAKYGEPTTTKNNRLFYTAFNNNSEAVIHEVIFSISDQGIQINANSPYIETKALNRARIELSKYKAEIKANLPSDKNKIIEL